MNYQHLTQQAQSEKEKLNTQLSLANGRKNILEKENGALKVRLVEKDETLAKLIDYKVETEKNLTNKERDLNNERAARAKAQAEVLTI